MTDPGKFGEKKALTCDLPGLKTSYPISGKMALYAFPLAINAENIESRSEYGKVKR